MKALLCTAYGAPEKLKLTEVDDLTPDAGEVIIEVHAAGLNYPDTLIIRGLYQFQPDLPFSPGGEVAGIVKSVGAGVSTVRVGDRVMAGTSWGGFAEEARAMASNTFVIPDEMSFEIAAASCMTYGTSYHALVDRASIKSQETILVLGASGGVGTAAIQIAKVLGARVIAAASTDDKLDYCRSVGADDVINYSKESIKARTKELTWDRGVDVVFDPVGGQLAEPAFRAIAKGGRYLVVGFAGGAIPAIPWNLPLLKSAAIVGVFWGGFFRSEPEANRKNFEVLVDWFVAGKLSSKLHKTCSLEEIPEAMNELLSRQVKGKMVALVR